MVVMAVIRMGRIRVRPPMTRASYVFIPCFRSWSTRASSTMAFVKTMPTSITHPIMAEAPRVWPVTKRPRKAPIVASGRLTIISSAFKKTGRRPPLWRRR